MTRPEDRNDRARFLAQMIYLRVKAKKKKAPTARAIGRDVTTLYKWESGRTSPTVDDLLALAEFYGCRLADFFAPRATSASSSEI